MTNRMRLIPRKSLCGNWEYDELQAEMRFSHPALEDHPPKKETGCLSFGKDPLKICMIITGVVTLLFPIAQATEAGSMPDGAEISPSRFIGPDQLNDYIKLVSSRFVMNTRKQDVFGRPEIPRPRIIRDPPFQKPDFASIIRRIQVQNIIPAEGSFMIQNRRFKNGDRIPIQFRSFTYRVEIAAVTARQIDFIDVETGEVASLITFPDE